MTSPEKIVQASIAPEDFYARLYPIVHGFSQGEDSEPRIKDFTSKHSLELLGSHLANCGCWRSLIDEMGREGASGTTKRAAKSGHVQNLHGVCTCGEQSATNTQSTTVDTSDQKSFEVESMHHFTKIRKLTEDNQWHLFSLDRIFHGQALALRPDGRMLSMPVTQYLDWKKIAPGQLKALVAGKAVQPIEKNSADIDEVRAFRRCGDCGRFCNALKAPAREQKKEEPALSEDTDAKISGQRKEESGAPASNEQTSTPRLKAVHSRYYGNTQEVFRIDPPCYCYTCSNNLWSPEGFISFADPNNSASLLLKMVRKIESCSRDTAQILQAHEYTLRRRWSKKKPSQRETILKRASDGKLMTYRCLSILLDDFYPRRRPGKLAMESEAGLFSVPFLLDDIVDDCGLLFDHLKARSTKHPSQFFLADMVKMRNSTGVSRSGIKYCPGSFSIRAGDYGVWQEWDDEKIHNFESVAASVAAATFLLQGSIYEVLDRVMKELGKNLGEAKPRATQVHKESESPYQLTSLPTLPDAGSIFWKAEPPQCILSDVYAVAEKKLAAAIDDLQRVRSDNKAFMQLINASKEFREFSRIDKMPESAYNTLYVHHVLGEPHDRVVMWTLIDKQILNVADASLTKQANNAQYVTRFRTLLCMLKQRYEWIAYFAYDLCDDCVNASAIVPSSLTGQTRLYSWLIKYFTGYLISGSQPLNAAFINKCITEQPDDFGHINMIVREWIEEALTITKILEMLLVIEPMLDVHEFELASHHDTIWSNMFSGSSTKMRCLNLRDRCEGALLNLKNPEIYRLPHHSQTRNDAWDKKYVNGKDRLVDTWEDFFDGLRKWSQNCDSMPLLVRAEAAALFDKIEDMTEPPAFVLPERKVHPGTPLASRKSNIESSSSDSIPHHHGPDTPSARKVTKRKLANEARKRFEDREQADTAAAVTAVAEMRVDEQPEDAADEESDDDEEESTDKEAVKETVIVHIPIKRRYLAVVDSLFSNAQEQVSNVRWEVFERFMRDAGCTTSYNDNAVTFSTRHIINGERKSCVIHRPHPDSTLYAVHLRNDRWHIEGAFGWKKEMFVRR